MKFGYRAAVAVLASLWTLGAVPAGADTYTGKGLYTFCSLSGCTDGSHPGSALLMDGSGNFYGTTNTGGDQGSGGTVFEFVKSGKGWKYRRLYSFCAQDSCADGSIPAGRLIMDTAGDLYGTTISGGVGNHGIVYELVPNGDRKKWKLKVLHDFCTSCDDGEQPYAGLSYSGGASGALYDGASPLFGTASMGGSLGGGTAFELTRNGKTWTETVLHSFCQEASCPDGTAPDTALVVDGSGNLFGTAPQNGAHNGGVIFELSLKGGKWSETVLYAFCTVTKCGDGDEPAGALLMDGSGNLFGVNHAGGSGNGGTLFKLQPKGKNSKLTTLYNFCSLTNCTDGQYPQGDLALDSSGGLFGAASAGGPDGSGEIFEFKKTFSVAYSFCANEDCSTGESPETGPTLDGNGNLFGVTVFGGAGGNDGEFFELSPE